MKHWRILALAACLFLSGCKHETVPAGQQELPQQTEQQTSLPVVETIPPVEELTPSPDYADWQEAYAAFLTEKAEQVAYLQNFERPDYDPDTNRLQIEEASGHYRLYDVDKDGVPELLFSRSSGHYTDFYGFRDGQTEKLGEAYTNNASLYHWPEENAVALNWAKMGGHTITRLSIEDGKLVEELVFEETVTAESSYTDITEVVPGSSYLWGARTYIEKPQVQALTLPIYDYDRVRTARPIDVECDEKAKAAIEEALSGFGAFYGVSADGFGGDTGWVGLEDYLAPGGVTPYNHLSMEIGETTWRDFNGDGQTDALVTIVGAEADDYGDIKQVIFSLEEDGVVYAYCYNYMSFYELAGTVFTGIADMHDFSVAFDGPQIYCYGVKE